jgi:hypothetical protein
LDKHLPATKNASSEVRLLFERGGSSMITILVILLVLALIGAFPSWPYSRGWGYYPSGGIGLILVILVVLMLLHVF